MYDVGLSSLVLKICSDYSQSLGLNFPPNVQQEINAIAKWVDTHTVKDIALTQDGNVVTVTATTQNNSSQSWVFTLPDISVDRLYTMIKGSDGINVDYSEDRNSLVISLDKSKEIVTIILDNQNSSGTLPAKYLSVLREYPQNIVIIKKLSATANVPYTYVYRFIYGGFGVGYAYYAADGDPNIMEVDLSDGAYDSYYVDSSDGYKYGSFGIIDLGNAIKGTLTVDQWNAIERNPYVVLICNKQYYVRAGLTTLSQIGSGNRTYIFSNMYNASGSLGISTILISSNKSWEQTDHSFSSGGKNYIHNVKVSTSNGYQLDLKILSSRIDKYTNVTSIEIAKFIGGYYRNDRRQSGIIDNLTANGSSINYLAVGADSATYLTDEMLEITNETVTKV